MSNGFITKNAYLNQGQQQNNAQIIWSICQAYGWEYTPVCAMLGNMSKESTVNPGIYQNLREPTKGASEVNWGYGLTQWTPATKLFFWCYENNLDYRSGVVQLRKIKQEVDSTRDRYDYGNHIQWIGPKAVDDDGRTYVTYTFWDFVNDTSHSLEWLVTAFMNYYERPSAKYADLPYRKKMAVVFYNFMRGQQGTYTPTPGQLSNWVITSGVPVNNECGMIPFYFYNNRIKQNLKRRRE